MKATEQMIIGIGVLLLGIHAVQAGGPPAADAWGVSTSLALISTPNYLGDDHSQLFAFPDVRVTYRDQFFASILGGAGYNIVKSNNWSAGPIVKYDFGRKEDGENPLRLSGNGTDDLIGLGDIDGSAEAGAFIKFDTARIQTKLEVRQGLSGGHEGLIWEAEAKYAGQFQLGNKPAFFSIGPEITYGNEEYNNAFFGINSEQSNRSGLDTYQSKAGLVSYGLHGSVVVPLHSGITLIGFAGFDMFGYEPSESSLVTQRGSDNLALGGLMVSYSF